VGPVRQPFVTTAGSTGMAGNGVSNCCALVLFLRKAVGQKKKGCHRASVSSPWVPPRGKGKTATSTNFGAYV
jgi:hypothetical protein